nr:RNA-dependent RNA polymerase [Narnavirus sp.]
MYNLAKIVQTERAASAQVSEPGTFQIPDFWVDRFVLDNPGDLLRPWGGCSMTKRLRLVRAKFSNYYVPRKHHIRLARLSRDQMKGLINLITSIEDNLLFSQPDWFPIIYNREAYKKLIRSVILQEIHKAGSFVDSWKKFTQWIRWHAYKSHTPRPELPAGFPGVHPREPDKLGHLWDTLTPWLRKIVEGGLSSKFQCTQLAHFLTSRSMPAASKRKRDLALQEHREVLTTEGPNESDRRYFLSLLMENYGKKLKKQEMKTVHAGDFRVNLEEASHVSLTCSASFFGPTNSGGRGAEIAREFREWLLEIPTEDADELTWFGHSYYLRRGVPRWQTMCRKKYIYLEGDRYNEGEKKDERVILELPSFPPEATFGGMKPLDDVDFENFKYTDPVYGIDNLIGCQLYQWSIEKGLSLNQLQGTPYMSDHGIKPNPTEPPRIKTAVIGEPGNKARVVTVGEAWLTIFLQPFSHVLAAYLKQDKNATAGFSKAWHGFEYVRRMAYQEKRRKPRPSDRFILSSDLKTATDYCPHGYARAMLEGFVKGLGYDPPLIQTWIELLTGPRRYYGRNLKETPLITKRGILMGDPGAKVVLSLFNIAAEREARLRYYWSLDPRTSDMMLEYIIEERGFRSSKASKKKTFLFAFSGDDHVAIGPKRYLEEITRSHTRNGMKVSSSTNYISNICGVFCEEQIFLNCPKVWEFWGSYKPLHEFPYDRNPHVSSLKLRLLSLCSKEFIGKEPTNPAVGMASTLRLMLSWLSQGWEEIRVLVTKRFRQKMRGLIPQNRILAALPRIMGGIDCPEFGLSREEFETHYQQIPDWFKRLLTLILRRSEDISPMLRRLLARIPGANAYRGIEADSIEEKIRETLSSTTCKAVKLSDFATKGGMTEQRWKRMKKAQQLNWVKKNTDFIPISTAYEILSRSIVFKEILLPTSDRTKPLGKGAFRMIKWEKRYQDLEKYLKDILEKRPETKELYDKVSEDEISEMKERIWNLIHNQEDLDLEREYWFVPRSVVESPDVVSMKLGNMGANRSCWNVKDWRAIFPDFHKVLKDNNITMVGEDQEFVYLNTFGNEELRIPKLSLHSIKSANDLRIEEWNMKLQQKWIQKDEMMRKRDRTYRCKKDRMEMKMLGQKKLTWTEERVHWGTLWNIRRPIIHRTD